MGQVKYTTNKIWSENLPTNSQIDEMKFKLDYFF